MVKMWFEVKNTKTALALAKEIWKLSDFDDVCIMIETPKKSIAFCGSDKVVGGVVKEMGGDAMLNEMDDNPLQKSG